MPAPRWFAHANVNTAELTTAERFYTDVIGLTPAARTAPALAQDGAGFGMGGQMVRWRGVLLRDGRTGPGPLVDLLEWTEPPTSGRAASEAQHLGHSALRFGLSDLDEAVTRVENAGRPWVRWRQRDQVGEEDLVMTSDPDGTRIELFAVSGTEAPVYAGVRTNCSDLARSSAFYQSTVGLTTDPVRSVTITDDDGTEVGRFRSQRMYLPGPGQDFAIELTNWRQPRTAGAPGSPGNHAGIYRVALTVEDLTATCAELQSVLPDAPVPLDVAIGDNFPVVRACFLPDPDGAIVEFIERMQPTRTS